MKKLENPTLVTYLNRQTILYINYLIVLSVFCLFMVSCKKKTKSTTTPEPETPAASVIAYKTYAADSLNFTTDSLFFDVNNDGTNDINVKMQHEQNNGVMNYGGSISAVNNNMSFCYIETAPKMKMLEINDVITNSNSLMWMPVAGYSGSTGFTTSSNSWAQGIFTKYFGFKLILNSKIYYGWFHFKWQTITETGINLTAGTSISVGQKQ